MNVQVCGPPLVSEPYDIAEDTERDTGRDTERHLFREANYRIFWAGDLQPLRISHLTLSTRFA